MAVVTLRLEPRQRRARPGALLVRGAVAGAAMLATLAGLWLLAGRPRGAPPAASVVLPSDSAGPLVPAPDTSDDPLAGLRALVQAQAQARGDRWVPLGVRGGLALDRRTLLRTEPGVYRVWARWPAADGGDAYVERVEVDCGRRQLRYARNDTLGWREPPPETPFELLIATTCRLGGGAGAAR